MSVLKKMALVMRMLLALDIGWLVGWLGGCLACVSPSVRLPVRLSGWLAGDDAASDEYDAYARDCAAGAANHVMRLPALLSLLRAQALIMLLLLR